MGFSKDELRTMICALKEYHEKYLPFLSRQDLHHFLVEVLRVDLYMIQNIIKKLEDEENE
jgi:hypothetical protein